MNSDLPFLIERRCCEAASRRYRRGGSHRQKLRKTTARSRSLILQPVASAVPTRRRRRSARQFNPYQRPRDGSPNLRSLFLLFVAINRPPTLLARARRRRGIHPRRSVRAPHEGAAWLSLHPRPSAAPNDKLAARLRCLASSRRSRLGKLLAIVILPFQSTPQAQRGGPRPPKPQSPEQRSRAKCLVYRQDAPRCRSDLSVGQCSKPSCLCRASWLTSAFRAIRMRSIILLSAP